MNLYRTEYDGGVDYIEADSFRDAIALWRQVKRVEWGEDFQEGDEPESCQRVHDAPVVRRGWHSMIDADPVDEHLPGEGE